MWTESLTKEDTHMKVKRGQRLAEFLAAGGDLPANLKATGLSREEIIDLFVANETRLAKAREKRCDIRRAAFLPREARDLTGKFVKWESADLQCPATIQALNLRTLGS